MRPIDADKLMEDVAAARPFFTVEASTSLARACKKYIWKCPVESLFA